MINNEEPLTIMSFYFMLMYIFIVSNVFTDFSFLVFFATAKTSLVLHHKTNLSSGFMFPSCFGEAFLAAWPLVFSSERQSESEEEPRFLIK